MKFGSVDDPDKVDFTLPDDHPETQKVLDKSKGPAQPEIYVGCAKWNRSDLKGFYPRGTKDELEYYSSQFNAIELNATFYRNFPAAQVEEWHGKVPPNFLFFPKVNQQVSHLKWLSDVKHATDDFLNSILNFKEKLGTTFLQLRDNFAPKFFGRVEDFIDFWPEGMPLAVEFRHTDWYTDPSVADELYALLEENNIANIIVDTAGRRDLMHMRLTNNEAFIRYVGANHPTDYPRLDDWVQRLQKWKEQGLRHIHFFVHQNKEKESPLLAVHFIREVNKQLGSEMKVPGEDKGEQGDLL